jgi:hypothetical protein
MGEVCRWWGCDWDVFKAKSGESKAEMIRIYLNRMQLDSVMAYEKAKDDELAARNKGK